MKYLNIAIDGPAGAGKSTISKELAKRLGIIYVDTGAMYRAVALNALRRDIDLAEQQRVIGILDDTNINIEYKNSQQYIILNGEDVTSLIRTNDVSKGSSMVAVIPEVRLKLVDLQRKIAASNNVIMDGRDIGTYVLPNANKKFFLTASIKERSLRRWNELKDKGIIMNIEEVKNDIAKRDLNDSSRSFAPLKKADDAIEIDTTNMDIEQVVKKILSYL